MAPKSLRDPHERQRRTALLREPHIVELTEFVERIRRENKLSDEIPFFDPFDAGRDAECIFILQAPGQGAVKSGFVSRDNDDEAARHFFELTREAGLDRRRTITWNAVPWLVEGRDISAGDLEDGLAYLAEILDRLLPKLCVMVMMGEEAQKLDSKLFQLKPRLKRFAAPLPSQRFINRRPENRERISSVLRDVARYLGPVASG